MSKIFYSFGFDSNDSTFIERSSSITTPYTTVVIPLHEFKVRNDKVVEDANIIRDYLKHNVDLFVDDLIAGIKRAEGTDDEDES